MARLTAELSGGIFTPTGSDRWQGVQGSLFTARAAEHEAALRRYDEKIAAVEQSIAKTETELSYYRERLKLFAEVEGMRTKLEQKKVGSRLQSLVATDSRLEMERSVAESEGTIVSARHELESLKAERQVYVTGRTAEIARDLADRRIALDRAREEAAKAERRRDLVELRAPGDAVVLQVGSFSVGSVVQPAERLVSLMPTDTRLEIDAELGAADQGSVKVGDEVVVKLDAWPFVEHGAAKGVVRWISGDSFTPKESGGKTYYLAKIDIESTDLRDVPADFPAGAGHAAHGGHRGRHAHADGVYCRGYLPDAQRRPQRAMSVAIALRSLLPWEGALRALRRGRAELAAGRFASAARELAAAAAAGDVEAAHLIAGLYERGEGVVTNLATAVRWHKLAAEKGHAGSQARLGALLIAGAPPPAGLDRGGGALAKLFPDGAAVPADPTAARRYAQAAAEAGNLDGAATLGFLLAAGLGGPVDPSGAAIWYRKAAEAGHVEAALGLGTLLAGGHLGAPDHAEARQWFEKAAAAGNSTAIMSVGALHLYGLGGPVDLEEAARWLTTAAERGNAQAMRHLGQLLVEGLGVEKDLQAAEALLRKAALRGDADAMARLGDHYSRGNGRPIDEEEAGRWYPAPRPRRDTRTPRRGCSSSAGCRAARRWRPRSRRGPPASP